MKIDEWLIKSFCVNYDFVNHVVLDVILYCWLLLNDLIHLFPFTLFYFSLSNSHVLHVDFSVFSFQIHIVQYLFRGPVPSLSSVKLQIAFSGVLFTWDTSLNFGLIASKCCVLVSWNTGHPRKTECLKFNRLFHFDASVSWYLLSSHIVIVLISETYNFWTPCTMSRFWWGPTNSVSGVWQGLTNTVSRFWRTDCFLIFQPHTLISLPVSVHTFAPSSKFNIFIFLLVPLFYTKISLAGFHLLILSQIWIVMFEKTDVIDFSQRKTVSRYIVLHRKVASVLWRLQSILLLVVCDVSASQPKRPLLSRPVLHPNIQYI